MAKGGTKFGTFGGVFTPSILTILGVIMYLRLPQVVGQGGLWQTLGIILAAHVISITTGFSISSIATDKKVGAGGPYYIVSRSLGLPIGGTLGLALFVGLSFSVSLYVIGFCESFLAYWDLPDSLNAVRLAGSIVLVVVTGVTLASTALAIKTQYFILTLIGFSLISIFLGGSPEAPAAPHLQAPADAPGFGVLFGIFFPAVTGFTAGVNMSGDLKDPKRSIPYGTLAAIAVGLTVYVVLAIFVAYRVDPAQLAGNTQILIDIAAVGWLVVAGIWGATLSSAMGSILGAPRILQALSVDRVTPRWCAKGAGKSNEPRRALIVAFVIAEAGILIGELDAIAEIVSMFFMATYGFLNLSCAIEAWASTDFRPTFKIPKSVSILGFVTVVLLMYQLNPLAMMGALVLFAGLFFWLKRRELTLESGDTWAGVWFSLVRSNLTRLSRSGAAARDYRPNVLAFTTAGTAQRQQVLAFAGALVRQRGMLTDIELCSGSARARDGRPDDEEVALPPGVFARQVAAEDPTEAISALTLHHGFTGLEPNTLMFSWSDHSSEPARVRRMLSDAVTRDLSVIAVAADLERELPPRSRRSVDLWWAPGRGNFSFALTLAKYLSMSDQWQLADLRFLVVNEDVTKTESLYRTAARAFAEARLEATVKVLNATLEDRTYEEWVRAESIETDLVALAFPNDVEEIDASWIERTDALLGQLGTVLVTRAATTFPATLHGVEGSRMVEAAAAPMGEDTLEVSLPGLELPAVPELAAEVTRVSKRLDAAAAELEETCLAPAYRVHQGLVERAMAIVESSFEQLADAAGTSGHRQRKTVSRVYAQLLQQSIGALTDFEQDALMSVHDTLDERIARFFASLASIKDGAPGATLTVYRGGDAEPSEEGERGPAALSKVQKTVVPLETLLAYHLEFAAPKVLYSTLERAVRHGSQTTIALAKALNSARLAVAGLAARARAGDLEADAVEEERSRVVEQLQSLLDDADEMRRGARKSFLKSTRQVAVELCWDLERPDLAAFARKERRLPRESRSLVETLAEVPAVWLGNERLLARRAQLELQIAVFQSRLTIIADRTKDAVVAALRAGLPTQLEELLASLHHLLERIKEKGRVRFERAQDLGHELDDRRIIDDLVRKIQAATSSLPESFQTLDEESILAIEERPFEEVEGVSVSVRRRVEFLVQAELIGRLQRGLAEAAANEKRALGVARDVLRLISFNINDLVEEDEDDDAFRDRLLPVVIESIGRLEVELERVRAAEPRLTELISRQLELVVDRTDAYAITGSEDGLKRYVGADGARRQALNRVTGAIAELQRTTKKGLMKVFYWRSEGIVQAHQLQAGLDHQETLIDHVLQLTRATAPRPDVLEALPFFYQQPFLGKTQISSDFWVGRAEEMADAARAIEHARRGSRGALIVTGERNAGKSALCRAIANDHFRRDRIYHVTPPPGGSIEPAAFKSAVEAELETSGEWETLFSTLREGSVLVLHDLEMWWQRTPDGLRVIELVLELVERYCDRCLFIINVGIRALRFMRRLTPITDSALALVDCGPLTAEVIKEIVMLRHRSTGLAFRLDGRDDDALAEWRLARLFSRHFDYSGGIIGAALQSWISHIDAVDSRRLEISTPSRPNVDVLFELPMEWVALLLELVLHSQVTEERLDDLCEVSPSELRQQLATLIRMGLVARSKQGVLEIDRYVEHFVTTHLKERGLLA